MNIAIVKQTERLAWQVTFHVTFVLFLYTTVLGLRRPQLTAFCVCIKKTMFASFVGFKTNFAIELVGEWSRQICRHTALYVKDGFVYIFQLCAIH